MGPSATPNVGASVGRNTEPSVGASARGAECRTKIRVTRRADGRDRIHEHEDEDEHDYADRVTRYHSAGRPQGDPRGPRWQGTRGRRRRALRCRGSGQWSAHLFPPRHDPRQEAGRRRPPQPHHHGRYSSRPSFPSCTWPSPSPWALCSRGPSHPRGRGWQRPRPGRPRRRLVPNDWQEPGVRPRQTHPPAPSTQCSSRPCHASVYII